jgi:Ca2+-binding RTX toxin-like protein
MSTYYKATNGDDWVWGSPGDDQIDGLDGNDKIKGNGGDDSIYGGKGHDWLDGGDGNDLLMGGAGADELLGGSGKDGVSYLDSPVGVAVSLYHNVAYFGTAEGDTFSSIEFVWGSDFADILVGDDGDNGLAGFNGDDYLLGLGGDDKISGDNGNDALFGMDGIDTLNGGSGNDWLWGGMGGDSLTGGIGGDTFSWNDTAESGTASWTRDSVEDFNRAEGDRLDLANIDANVYTPGNQAFTFIGTADFSGIGQIRYYHDNGNTYIEMQTSIPTSDPEGVICLHGIHTPDASWFTL